MIVLWLAAGLLWPLLLPALPASFPGFYLLVGGIAVSLYFKKLPLVLVLTGTLWTLFNLQLRLEQRLDPVEGQSVIVRGWVSDIPVARGDMLGFRFMTRDLPGGHAGPVTALVRWYKDWPEIRAGEFWQLELKLKPARSRVNFHGPDREKWYFSENISVIGIVKPESSHLLPETPRKIPAWRQGIRNELIRILGDHETRPVLLALALADRSEITPHQWKRFRTTGTSHLLAISGMHVALAAMLGFWIGRSLMLALPTGLALTYGLAVSWFLSIIMAVGYSVLANLATSTRRALLMLLVIFILHVSRRNTGPAQGLVVALLVVLLVNPLAPLAAGFWFSFTAVAALLAVLATRHGGGHWLMAVTRAQAGLMVVMFPLSMLWFQQVTVLGLISNLVAIPWISFAVVPSLLISLLLMPLDVAATPFLLFSAAESMRWLSRLLEWIARSGGFAWMETGRPGFVAAVLAILGGFLLLLPRGVPLRLLGVLMIAPLTLPQHRHKGQVRLEMLDVGQGLATLVETGNTLLLYDAGPGDRNSWSLVSSAIAPSISASVHGSPDITIISHGDLDHAGGLSDARSLYPGSRVLASLRYRLAGVEPCHSPATWEQDGVEFEILHPGAGLPYLGNDSSCVLSVTVADHSVLLTGDISRAVEHRLVQQGVKPHSVLLAPHHGSKSSSSVEFLNAIRPDFTLVSSGFQNRFGFPHSQVRNRLELLGSPLINTAECGAVQIMLQPGENPKMMSARHLRKAVWRWPAGPDCP